MKKGRILEWEVPPATGIFELVSFGLKEFDMDEWIERWFEGEEELDRQMNNHQTAWHYNTANGAKGTLVGSDIRTEGEARAWIARQHRCEPEEVNIKAAGEEWVREC